MDAVLNQKVRFNLFLHLYNIWFCSVILTTSYANQFLNKQPMGYIH